MLLADAMSRYPLQASEEIKLDMRVNYIAFNKTWIAKLKGATWGALNSSPNYLQSNGFIERQIQTVKRLMKKATCTGSSFQKAQTSLREQPLGDGLPSQAEILLGRSLITRKATPVVLIAVHQSLIALQ